MNYRLLILTLLSGHCLAETWQCDTQISYGPEPATNQAMEMVITDGNASMITSSLSINVGQLGGSGSVVESTRQQISSVADERITTAMLFRLDQTNGHLIFFDHDNDGILIRGKCKLKRGK